MANLKNLLSSVREQLQNNVPELAYVYKNRGQLTAEMPPAQFPCALIDAPSVKYTQGGKGTQMADIQITVTVAVSPAPQQNDDPYLLMELIDKVHAALHLFTADGCSPLFRTNLQKAPTELVKECYEVIYQTAGEVGYDNGQTFEMLDINRVKIETRHAATDPEGPL